MAFPPVPFQEWFLRQTSTGNAALNAYVARVKADGGVVETIGCVPLAVWDWVAPVAPTLLLDLFPNAAAAYSLRKIRAAYSGSAVRVRKEVSTVSSETDIGFLADGSLDTTSLLAFASDADSGDVFVVTWYDQSLSNDATQSTAAAQPKIVSGGSLVVMGGASKAAIEGSISSLSLTTALTPTDFSIIHTSEGSGFVANIGEYIRISNYYRYNIDGNNYISSDADSSQPSIYIGNRNGTTLNLRRNGSEMDSSPHTSVATALNITTIFNRSTLYFVGKISEFIIFESNQSSNFSGIETNLNTFYSIYP